MSAAPNVHVLPTPEPDRPAKFNAVECGAALAAKTHYAVGGQQVYVYEDGAYRPGERRLQKQILSLLGKEWNTRRAHEIAAYMRVTSAELWPEPPRHIINCRNGLLNVKTGQLTEHTPEHLSPVQITAEFDPDAGCPQIESFIESTIPDLASLYYEIVGYLLAPDNRYQKAFFFLGPGGTGKSTAASIAGALIGQENYSTRALHELEEDRFATADLYGKLANIFSDLDARALRASSQFKAITGGDRITAERKHRDAFEFKAYARLLFSANEAPPTTDSSDAFFERWIILPFLRKHRGTDHCDEDLLEKLTAPAELSGLLNHALAALHRLHQQKRFTRAASSEKAAERFRIDSDSVAGFLEDACTIGPDERVIKPHLYRAYASWCERNGRKPLSSQRYGRRLRELLDGNQLTEIASKGKDWWIGLTLKDTEP